MPIHDWTRVYSGLFHDFHQSWSIYIKNALNAGLLPDGMEALVEQKSGPKQSDVLAVDAFKPRDRSRMPSSGGTAVLERPATRTVKSSHKKFYAAKANRIVVKHNLGRTVAVIEIVSPGNKDSKRAFTKFIEKSLGFLSKGIHLLVVDLFPPSKRDPSGIHQAIWDEIEDGTEYQFPSGKDRTLVSYKSVEETAAYVEPLALGDVMPAMPLFLFEDFHVNVPLQPAYDTAWSVLPKRLQNYVLTGINPTGNTTVE